MTNIVILGGGTGGSLVANRLRRMHPASTVRSRRNDLIEQVQDIITVGEFYEMAAGGQIIFT